MPPVPGGEIRSMRSPYLSRHGRVRAYPAVLLALALAACSSNNSTQPSLVSGTNGAGSAASLSISPSSATDSIGRSTQFTATAYDSRGLPISNRKVRWFSRDSTIIRIDSTGRARRWGVGRTTVTATVDSVSATAQTTALGVPIASIVVTPNPANTAVGQATQFAAATYDSAGNALTGRPVTWLSSAPSVIAIDTTGMGTDKSVGTATISATSAGVLGVASVNVTGTTSNLPGTVVDLAAVASSPTATTLSFTAVGDGTGGNASYDVRFAVHPISWGSAAAVSSGTCSTPVTGTTAGSAINCTVTGLAAATDYDFQVVAYRGTISNNAVFGPLSNVATATTPSAPAASVAQVIVSPSTVSDTVGQHYQFTASVRDSAGNVLTGRTVTWASSATGVVTVNSSGYTTSVGAGSASVRATSGSVTGSAQITVVAAPVVRTVTSVTVTPTPDTLALAATQQLTATIKDQNGAAMTGLTPAWSSSATGVATVSSSGRVTAVSAGTATITATNSGKSGTATIVVTSGTSNNPPPPAPTGTTEPSFNSATGVIVFSDNMDAYTSTTAMQSYSGSGMAWKNIFVTNLDNSQQVITPGYGGTGQALREVYSGANQDSHTWDLINVPTMPDTTTHYFQYWGRVTVSGSLGSTVLAFKWFMAFHRDGNRIQWNTHDHLPCALQNGNVASYWQVYDTGGETTCQANQPVGPYPKDVFNGQWHRFTYEYKPNTAPGSRDGIARMWIDGTKVIDISASAVGVTPAGGYKTWCNWDDLDALSTQGINMVRWAGNLTTVTPAFTVDMDDFRWWRAK